MAADFQPSLWSAARRGKGIVAVDESDHRTHFERDYDRLLFSSAVRRMADKTQVFPLERDGAVRNRLTHSHEVSNLARSIGIRLARKLEAFEDTEVAAAVPVILSAVGLAHDLGNPPFGHRGEEAIRSWFEANPAVFKHADAPEISADQKADFLNFEGNAQTLRLVGCLQVSRGECGLDLTATTLAALMKYTAPASRASKKMGRSNASLKKPGYALSEEALVAWIRAQTGLAEGQRHPLTWVMEACDDIAYSVLDVEDAMKRSIASPEDVLHHLEKSCGGEPKDLLTQLRADFASCDSESDYSRVRENKSSYLRTRLIERLVIHVADEFAKDKDNIYRLKRTRGLLESASAESTLCEQLKQFARRYTYNHPTVLRSELEGATALTRLMDWFWLAITEREDVNKPESRRKGAFATYVYNVISENYRWEFESGKSAAGLPMRYRELRLLTDMISGMTDDYVMDLFAQLRSLSDGRPSN